MPQIQFEDKVVFDKTSVRVTKDGYLVAEPRVARMGIQIYAGKDVGKPDMETVRVYRPESTVFNKDSMATYAHRPITIGHPPEMVDSSNWSDYSVGISGEQIARDGDFLRVPMVIMDKKAIASVMDGSTRELSVGYMATLDWQSGKTADGEDYDAVQTAIETNHIAAVARARGGSNLRLGDDNEGDHTMPNELKMKNFTIDGMSLSLPETEGEVVNRTMNRLTDEVRISKDEIKKLAGEIVTANDAATKAKKEVETKDGEIAVLKKQIEDGKTTPAQLDKMVTERVELLSKAKLVLGDKADFSGKTTLDIQKMVVAHKLGDSAKAMTDAAIEGAYAAVIAQAGTGAAQHLSDSLGSARPAFISSSSSLPVDGDGKVYDQKRADDAFLSRGKKMQDAWKGGKAN